MTKWSLIVCGDWAPINGLESAVLANPSEVYHDVLPVLQDADLAVVNLEGALIDKPSKEIIKDGAVIRFDTSVVSGLISVPFHLACLANNHSFDFGSEGCDSTISELQDHNILSVGGGTSEINLETYQVFTFGTTQLAIINVAEGEEGKNEGAALLDLSIVLPLIQDLKTKVDLVMVIVHAGCENVPIPAPYIRAAYRSMAEAGANLVVGHHPHVPQPLEQSYGATIAYSLGNFLMFEQGSPELNRIGYLFKADFDDHRLSSVEPIPYRIQKDGIYLITGIEKDQFLSQLNQYGEYLISDDDFEAIWEAYSDQWFVKQGITTLLDNAVLLSGKNKVFEATIKSSVLQYQGNRFSDKIMVRFLWRLFSLARRYKSTPDFNTDEARKAAAILRNRFDTQAHRDLYLRGLKRVMNQTIGTAPAWAYQLVEKWI